MSANSFGEIFRITTFGESHGPALGVVIDGCPAQLPVDESFISKELGRRKPGQSSITTSRDEAEIFEILSGVFEGKTTGAPIAVMVRNQDQRSSDYDALKDIYRPSHADYTWQTKYGIRDHRGSGRASARETISRVIGGAFAKMLLAHYGIKIQAYVSSVANIHLEKSLTELVIEDSEKNIIRCPDEATAQRMISYIESIAKEGDTVGGTISCVCEGIPVGIGEPVFDKLHAILGHAILSINACKGIEFGSGFEGCTRKGSEENDVFVKDANEQVTTLTNHSGGIQGGISNGQNLFFNAAFKPVSTIRQTQNTLNHEKEEVNYKAEGRHDPCVLPRAVVIVEAMTALVLADMLLRNQSAQL